jgi:hypothetical protein
MRGLNSIVLLTNSQSYSNNRLDADVFINLSNKMKSRTYYPTLYFPWGIAISVSVPVSFFGMVGSSISPCENVVGVADEVGCGVIQALSTDHCPNLYNDASARKLRGRTNASKAIRYLRKRSVMGGEEDAFSVAAMGS